MPPSAPAATTSTQALSNLQSFDAGAKSPDQIYKDTSAGLGIPAAQQQVSGLRGAINNTTQLLSQVAPSVMGRTGNSLVTSAQANRQIGNEQAPLNDQLNKENTDYSGASSDLNSLLGQANTQTSNNIAGQNSQLSYLQGIYSDLAGTEQQATANQLARDQLNAQIADSKAKAASGGISLAGTGRTPTGPTPPGSQGSVGTMNMNSTGGFAFSNAQGKPVTLARYLVDNGYQGNQILQKAAEILATGKGGDQGIANAISGGRYTPAQLAKLYPQVFGGAF